MFQKLDTTWTKTKICIAIRKTDLHFQMLQIFDLTVSISVCSYPQFWDDFLWFSNGSQIQHSKYPSAEIWEFVSFLIVFYITLWVPLGRIY